MSYTLDPSDHFRRRFAKFIKKHPDLKTKIAEIFTKLESDPFDPPLKLHKLPGKLNEFHAVSITYQY